MNGECESSILNSNFVLLINLFCTVTSAVIVIKTVDYFCRKLTIGFYFSKLFTENKGLLLVQSDDEATQKTLWSLNYVLKSNNLKNPNFDDPYGLRAWVGNFSYISFAKVWDEVSKSVLKDFKKDQRFYFRINRILEDFDLGYVDKNNQIVVNPTKSVYSDELYLILMSIAIIEVSISSVEIAKSLLSIVTRYVEKGSFKKINQFTAREVEVLTNLLSNFIFDEDIELEFESLIQFLIPKFNNQCISHDEFRFISIAFIEKWKEGNNA